MLTPSEILKRYVLDSPGWKTFFFIVIPIVSGVLSGVFVSEISGQSGIEWGLFYKSKSFYGLILLTFLIYLYNKSLYAHQKEINSFLDNDYCVAYMRSKCLPEAAEKYRQMIRDGQGGELKQAMDELKKILK